MSVHRKSRHERRYNSAADWPNTPETDGFFWNLNPDAEAPTGPSEADAKWASENLNQGGDYDTPPDEYYDQLAAESEFMDRIERGLMP
jgi:hypothetical protein